jgi:comEA protein
MSTTPQERLALGVAAMLLVAGVGARMLHRGEEPVGWSGPGVEADSAVAARLREEVAGEVKRAELRDRPLAQGEKIDPNSASADELARLPKVGKGTAEKIVARREERGPFRSLADLDSVPGIGPAALAALAPHVTLAPAPASASVPGTARRSASTAASVSSAVPGDGVVELNRASAEELEALPGVGPALARRIVEHRASRGRFRGVDDLDEVPGIGPAMLERLRPRVRATP